LLPTTLAPEASAGVTPKMVYSLERRKYMPRFEIDVDPCDHITADAIGNPGQRVFYLQAYQDQRTITVIIEKTQLH
jgi:hypothetical protein